MTAEFPLSEGALREIMRGSQLVDPIMQVLGSKKIASSSSDKDRFRILLSDGKYIISFAMLTTQINEQVVSGQLPDNSIIKIKRYVTSVINNAGRGDKRVLVILDMEMLVSGEKLGKIGSPEQLPDDDDENRVSKLNGTTNGNSTAPKPNTYMQKTTSNTVTVDSSESLSDQLTHPISSLSPYQNKWVIKARVANKSDIRTWSNSRGEGKLFSMDLVDESGEIRVTAFRDQVDKFYDFIVVDKVYYFSKCQLKMADKRFTNLKNDYEMTLGNDSIIQVCHDTVSSIPQTQYDFTSIDKLANIETGTFVDVIGVCKSASDVQTFQAKTTGRELKKREITVVDQSNAAIALTLWGSEAEKFDGSSQPIIAIKGAKVGEFGGGKNISVLSSSIVKINPDMPESHRLRGWFDNGGKQMDVNNISARSGGGFQTPWISFKEVQDQGLGNAERGDYYQVKGTILLIRQENVMYKACPTEECNKKVVDLENGMYRCEKCNREYPNFKYRLLAQMHVGDWSGNQWVSAFTGEVEKILGKTSKEVGEASEIDSNAIASITDQSYFKQFIFKCRAKMEVYNDENRLKTVVVKVDPVNYTEYNAHLISRIQQLTNI